jgi:hypothetical protein
MRIHPIHIPRSIAIALFVLIIITFLSGTIHAFVSAKAPAASAPLGNIATVTPTALQHSASPTPAGRLESADTTGIAALGVLVMVIVLFGVAWGSRLMFPRLPKRSSKK